MLLDTGSDSLDTDEDEVQAMENELVASKLDCNHDDQPIEEQECPGQTTEEVCSLVWSRHKQIIVTSKLYRYLLVCNVG